MYRIFDIHAHIYPDAIADKAVGALGKFYDFKVNGNGTLCEYEEHAKTNNTLGMLILASVTNVHQMDKANGGAADFVASSRSRGFLAYGFAGMHQDTEDFGKELDKALSLGLCGVKIHPDIQRVNIDDKRLLKLYEIMEERDIPLYLHMGDERTEYKYSTADRLVNIKRMFPELAVVAAHLGGYTAWDEAEKLASLDKIWFDTSSSLWVLSPEKAEYMIRLFGADRVMFGTDYPVKFIETELELFMAINLSEAERKAILFDNAARFLKMESGNTVAF